MFRRSPACATARVVSAASAPAIGRSPRRVRCFWRMGRYERQRSPRVPVHARAAVCQRRRKPLQRFAGIRGSGDVERQHGERPNVEHRWRFAAGAPEHKARGERSDQRDGRHGPATGGTTRTFYSPGHTPEIHNQVACRLVPIARGFLQGLRYDGTQVGRDGVRQRRRRGLYAIACVSAAAIVLPWNGRLPASSS